MNAENIKNEAYQLIDKYFMPAKAIIVKDFLNTYGFWDAPASTKYHGNYPGGLAEHSLAVAKNLMMLTEKLDLKWDNPGSSFIVGLLHDVCKMDQYKLISTENDYQYVYTNDSMEELEHWSQGDLTIDFDTEKVYNDVMFTYESDEEFKQDRLDAGFEDDDIDVKNIKQLLFDPTEVHFFALDSAIETLDGLQFCRYFGQIYELII